MRKLRDLSIDKLEFANWLKKVRPDPGYLSITEASKLLGVNEEFCYQLVNRGYLQYKMDSRNARVIFPDHIRQFRQEYVILAKLSEKSRLSSAWITELLDTSEIFPIDHDDSKKLRQKLYSRADVLKSKLFFRYVQHVPEKGL